MRPFPQPRGGRGVRLFLRRFGFIISLLLAAIVVYAGLHTLRRALAPSTKQGVMQLATCSARLSVLGIWPDDPTLDQVRPNQFIVKRRETYARMAEDVSHKGITLGGVITQGLAQKDLFRMTIEPSTAPPVSRKLGGDATTRVQIQPVLKPLGVPVRAMILPLLEPDTAGQLFAALTRHLTPVLPEGGVWLQDPQLYHATVYHASSHMKPVPGGPEVVLDELQRIQGVTAATCPIRAVLERVVLTSTGVVVACWQASAQGGEPALLRQALAAALPHAPPADAQMVREPTILHTTLARLLQPLPEVVASATGAGTAQPGLGGSTRSTDSTQGGGSGGAGTGEGTAAVQQGGGRGAGGGVDTRAVSDAVLALSEELCGLQAVFREVWFVEELDLLALALRGRFVEHRAPLTCPPAS